MRKLHHVHGLARPKVRQSWNKYNLFNLARGVGKQRPVSASFTFFQQKWSAKARTRAYHGEHVPEKKWVRLFSRRLQSAVEMPPRYLASHDGSEQAAGRGSGLHTTQITAESFSKAPQVSTDSRDYPHPQAQPRATGDVNHALAAHLHKMTPYMQMTFAPLERRIDTAIFRALFASSVRQARQFVIHGAVKVNGKKMVHPSYLLNPGDMFQVDIEKVMFATGAPKSPSTGEWLKESAKMSRAKEEALVEKLKQGATEDGSPNTEAKEQEGQEEEPDAEADGAEGSSGALEDGLGEADRWQLNNHRVKELLKTTRQLLENEPKDMTAKEKKKLRLFRTELRRFLSKPEKGQETIQELLDDLHLQMKNHDGLRQKFFPEESQAGEQGSAEGQDAAVGKPQFNRQQEIEKGLEGLTEEQKEKAVRIMGDEILTGDEMRKLGRLLQYDEENPVDESKPYATPWRPRRYMSAFAFIPRYLEVNPNICAAVYLRHPVARKGLAEVPTPFSYLTNQLAHNWYLERG